MKLSEGQYCEAQGKEGLGKLSENQNCEAHGKGGPVDGGEVVCREFEEG